MGVQNPVGPIPGDVLPPPERVPGKEYSHEFDKDAAGQPDPGQVIAWDGVIPPGGAGGGVADTFDYDIELDALANKRDVLFFDLIANQTFALFSERTVQGFDTGFPIYYEDPSGGIGPWATALQVDQHGVDNLDGLEVWGPTAPLDPDPEHRFNDYITGGLDGPQADDANMFSLFGDAVTSVFAFTSAGPTPYISRGQIAAALGMDEQYVDVDTMMAFDLAGNSTWDVNDWLIFSLWPNTGIVGDEVWVWQNQVNISFLNHGGHDWDSNWLGTNIDALEAASVPEPCTMILLGSGLLALAGFSRKKFKKS